MNPFADRLLHAIDALAWAGLWGVGGAAALLMCGCILILLRR